MQSPDVRDAGRLPAAACLLIQLKVGRDELQRDEGAVGFGARVRRRAVGGDGRRLGLARAAGELAVGLLVEVDEVQAAEARGREAQRPLARPEDEDQALRPALDARERGAHARLAGLRLAQRVAYRMRERL